jgi:hypothetical protein
MSIANLKKLAAAFNVPHGASTTAGHECLHCVCEAARKEVEALEKAAKAATTDSAFWVDGMMDPEAAIRFLETIAKEST